MNANNKGLWDGFGSVTIYPVDPDPLGTIIPENAVQFNLLKQEVYQQCCW